MIRMGRYKIRYVLTFGFGVVNLFPKREILGALGPSISGLGLIVARIILSLGITVGCSFIVGHC